MSVKSFPSDSRWDRMRKSLLFLGTFLFNTSCKQTSQILCPWRGVGGAGCAARVWAQAPADELLGGEMGEGLAAAWEDPPHTVFLSDLALLCWAAVTAACRYVIRPAGSGISEGGKWWHWNATAGASGSSPAHRSVWTLNPLRHSPPAGHCRVRFYRVT